MIATAKAAGAETISLIPRNDGTGLGNGERQANLRVAMKAILPMLQDAALVALVEPLGFQRSSLCAKAELVDTIAGIEGAGSFKLVHDTFHHTLAGSGLFYPEFTGIVHISGVIDPALGIKDMEDEHRVLVDEDDRLGNIPQIHALTKVGYAGPVSYECFSLQTHALADPFAQIKRSFEFIAFSYADRGSFITREQRSA
ncbi:TIM barrel protein [Yoonia sp.]|uniref:TIM barrel protein n=1 Tax=Yoonia sp. TaxID=2212373 RepID=UPI0025FEEEDB|nr:TIM barrel protein [Yoonia sp.]